MGDISVRVFTGEQHVTSSFSNARGGGKKHSVVMSMTSARKFNGYGSFPTDDIPAFINMYKIAQF